VHPKKIFTTSLNLPNGSSARAVLWCPSRMAPTIFCLTLAICFSAAQLRESRQTLEYARCRDYGRGEGPKAPRNVPPAHQTSGPALCRARTNSREDTRGRGLREPRLAKATCCWRDRQPCYPSHVARATEVRRDPRVHCNPARARAGANALAI
jgi:hypothetical protein